MKFQNPSFKIFSNGRTHGRTDAQTHGRTDKPKAICSPLFQSWGHKNLVSTLALSFLIGSSSFLQVIRPKEKICVFPVTYPKKLG